jgi:hypothetical protein
VSTNFILTEEQSSKTADQLSFDFQSIAEMNEKDKNAVKLNIPNGDPQRIKIPYLNTPDNFLKNFAEISTVFESDTVEAARYLLRVMTKPSRDLTLTNMQKAGCSDRESYHRYLMDYLQKERETPEKIAKISKIYNGKSIDNKKVTEIVQEFRVGNIDENTAKVRLRTEANYPEWVGTDQLLWHGNEFRTMLAAMYYYTEHNLITSDHVWYDKDGNTHNYTLFDPDAEC